MNIAEAKQQVMDTVEAYLAKDEGGMCIIPPSRQRPVFLLGAPGIGKTAIMEQISQELGIGLVSYSMTHHTRQSALGLPRITHEEFEGMPYEASEYTMSEIIASMYDYMKSGGHRKGILFLDEINCVSETLYPSMLQFLQFKTFGKHRVPADWIVVCAGNPPEYNKSVHEFDIVTLDRLRKVEIEPDYAAWKKYAQDHGTHPAVLTYLDVRKEDFYKVESKPSGKTFVTARGWSDLSDLMKLFEDTGKTVDANLISQFLQDDEIASRFAVYYDLFNKYRSDYQVDSILDGTVDESIVKRGKQAAFDERVALMGLLLDALSAQMKDVCEEEDLLVELRDVLRESKKSILDGQSAVEVLGEAIAEREQAFESAAAKANVPTPRMRLDRRMAIALRELSAACTSARLVHGAEAFALIEENFLGRASLLDPAVQSVEMQLDNAFTYVDLAFDREREGLVFAAELTARKDTSEFISRFGSESYFSHNDAVLVDQQKQDLFARIDAAAILEGDEAAEDEVDDREVVERGLDDHIPGFSEPNMGSLARAGEKLPDAPYKVK